MEVIYKIVSPKGKVYIGRTNNFENRMAQHKHAAIVLKNSYALYKAIRKYGWDNFKKEIITEVDDTIASKIEEEFILAYDSVKKGYNNSYLGSGGDNWKGRRDTTEYMEWIEKMKIINQNNRMHGKTHSSETKQKQKERAKGRYSLEWFQKRNGMEEGKRLYEERRMWLKNRNLPKDEMGRFIKS
jgi:group I intron endonuclease